MDAITHHKYLTVFLAWLILVSDVLISGCATAADDSTQKSRHKLRSLLTYTLGELSSRFAWLDVGRVLCWIDGCSAVCQCICRLDHRLSELWLVEWSGLGDKECFRQ